MSRMDPKVRGAYLGLIFVLEQPIGNMIKRLKSFIWLPGLRSRDVTTLLTRVPIFN